MNRKGTYSLLIALLLIAACALAYWAVNARRDMQGISADLVRHLQKEDLEIRSLLSNERELTRLFLDRQRPISESEPDLQAQALCEKPYHTFLFAHKRPVFWSTQQVLPPEKIWKTTAEGIIRQYVKLPSGDFICYKKGLWVKDEGSLRAVVLLPVSKIKVDGKAGLHSEFPLCPDIPANIYTTSQANVHGIGFPGKRPLFYLQDSGMPAPPLFPSWLALCSCLAFLALCISIRHLSHVLRARMGHFRAGILLLACLLAMSWGMHQSGLAELLVSRLPFLRQSGLVVPGIILNGLLDSFFLLWLVIYFSQETQPQLFQPKGTRSKLILGYAFYTGILVTALLFCSICQALILKPSGLFDFDNVFSLDFSGMLVLFQVVLLIFSCFLISQRLAANIVRLQMPMLIRIGLLSISFLLLLPYLQYSGLRLPLIPLILSLFIVLVLFELFSESERPNFSWMIIWLLVYAGFSSILLYKFNRDKEEAIRYTVVEQLAAPGDSMALAALGERLSNLPGGDRLNRQLLKPAQYERIARSVETRLQADPYLRQYYLVQVFPLPDRVFRKQFLDTYPIRSMSEAPGFSYWLDDSIPHHFIGEISLPGQEGSLGFDIQRNKLDLSQIPAFQGNAPPFKGISRLREYQYAAYVGDQLEESKGPDFPQVLSDPPKLAIGQMMERFEEKRSILYYQAGPDYLILLARNLAGLGKPLSLFSYLFIFLVFAVAILLLANRFLSFLPPHIQGYLSGSITLRNKIQLSYLALILFSFLIIGSVTVFYFRNAADRNQRNNLRNKTLSVLSDIQTQVTGSDTGMIAQPSLTPVLKTLAAIHQTPVELYDPYGRLLAASDERLSDPLNRSGMISPGAYWELVHGGKNFLLKDREQLGKVHYQAAYALVTDYQNRLQAILSLPNYQPEQDRNTVVSDFMSTLLNVYVFLLLIAGAIALFIANSITKPLSDLGEKLRRFKLGKRNEPLEWKNTDELGVLIREYNQMIAKLEKSAEVMAQNEREGAWREMAKQVAHEIKNPLTPMKLSIQYLEHAFRSGNPDDYPALVKRVSETLIEQIDNLAKIATEFSNFAKMPQPQLEKIALNDLVASVHDLFRKRSEIDFNLYVPIDEVYVQADRSHLIRVLNNLLKNAVQAIPATRKGIIDIRLTMDGGTALLCIEDNGVGIAKEMREKVFFPNFTTKSSGTGLGLAMCKSIIESFRGRIYFKTRVNEGTAFYVELPLSQESSSTK